MRCRDCGDPLTREREKAVATGEWAEVWQGSETWVCVLTGNEHVPTDDPACWVVIERRTWEGEHMPDLVIGPYPSPDAAQLAMEESALVDGICCDTKRAFSVEDDVYVTDDANPEGERLYVDMDDPDHTGITSEANADVAVVIGWIGCGPYGTRPVVES